MKKFLAILLVLSMIVVLCSCTTTKDDGGTTGGDTQGSSSTAKKDTVTVAMTQDRGTLDPAHMLGYDLMNAMRMIYEPLWDYDAAGNRFYVLATSMEMVEPTIWHVKLREGIKFANGNDFKANDVLFSLKRANNRAGEPASFPVLNLEKTKALDDYNVEIVYDSYDMAYEYSFAMTYMYDEETCNADVDDPSIATTPIGTGPYELSAYVINSHLDLKARESGYWGDAPATKNLHFIIMSEDSQRVTALQTGTADIVSVPYQDIKFVQGLKDVTVDVAPASGGLTIALYFNPAPTSVFYDNPDARKAVALALDRQAMCDIAYSGFATVSRHPVSVFANDAEERFFDLGVYGIGYNVDMAKEFAEKSGLVGKKVLLVDNGSSDRQVVAELIQSNLKDIGVEVDIHNLDPGSWLSIVFDDSQYDMAIDMTTAPSNTLAQNYYSWINYHIGGSFTRNPWPGKDRALEMINRIMSVSDKAELSEMYMELTQIHIEAMLWYNLVDLQRATGYSSGLKGYTLLQSGGAVDYSKLGW